MANINSSTVDVSATLPQPTLVGANSITDYGGSSDSDFAFRGVIFTTNPDDAIDVYSGDYSETNLMESVRPFKTTVGIFPSAKTRYIRPVLFIKDNHEVPADNAVGVTPKTLGFCDSQAIQLSYNNNFEKKPVEVVEVNSDTTFTVLLRNVDGSTITVYYEPGNQAGFVSGVNLSGEADGVQSGVSTVFVNTAGDDASPASARSGQTIDVTIADGEVTALAINAVGTNYASGDLITATLAGGAVIRYRYLAGVATYTGFNAILPLRMETTSAHGLSVGDSFVMKHDSLANVLFSGLNIGNFQYVDEDALYFMYQEMTFTNFNNPSVTTPALPAPSLLNSSAALPNGETINPNTAVLGTGTWTVEQRLNPQYKAVKLTCPSAWEIQLSGSGSFIPVAANVEYIFRYNGENDGFFRAKVASGAPTLTWEYFVG